VAHEVQIEHRIVAMASVEPGSELKALAPIAKLAIVRMKFSTVA